LNSGCQFAKKLGQNVAMKSLLLDISYPMGALVCRSCRCCSPASTLFQRHYGCVFSCSKAQHPSH